MVKRKRLDARSFRAWHIAQAKKNNVIRASTPENRDVQLEEGNDELEASCKKLRIDSEVKSPLGDGEAILEQYDSRVSEGCEQASSTDILLHEKIYGEVMENGECGAKEKFKDQPYFKTRLPRYIEYWVPVGLSYVQLEKYCEALIKNSMFLCSSLKQEVLDGIHAILTTIKQCCDHPYLVDSSLQKFVNDGRPTGDYLSNDIEVSGKFLLLDKLLQDIKEKQLKVLIVFQSNDSKPPSIKLQHILDDLICEKVGKECYVHIYREFDSTKKRAAVELFNDKDSGKLVMLIEKNSCQSSIKLSSLDCVILFNSDWNPINDMKSLRKMSIQSKFDHLKVFRLYSSNTVEEKTLTLAKEGTALENNLNNFSHNISHMLLLWGSSYLFSKLDEFHSHCSSISNLNSLSEDELVLDVHNELSVLLSCLDRDDISCSFISKVPEANIGYSRSIALYGEQDEPARDDDLPPFVIWNSLFEGRNSLWKLLPGSPERMRRRVEPVARPAQCTNCNNEDTKTTSQNISHTADESLCLKPRVRKVSVPATGRRDCKIAGYPKSRGNAVKLSSCIDDHGDLSWIDETCLRRMRELIQKQKKEIRDFYRTKRGDRAKLEVEHQLEVELLNQRHRETAHKQEQLKILDLIYEQKLQEHNSQMDTKKKELEDEHSASRMKEKQLKGKLFAWLKTKNQGSPTSSVAELSLIETALGQANLIENTIDSKILISNIAPVSDSKHSQEIEIGMINASVQCDDPKFAPDHVLTETEILSAESDEESNAVSMAREEVCDSAEHNDLIVFPDRASTSTSLCENQSNATQHATNREIEGDGSTNMESSKEMHGTKPMCLVSGSLESDGENDVAVAPSGQGLDTCTEVLNRGSHLCTSSQPQLHASSGQSCADSLSHMSNRKRQDEDRNIKAPVEPSNEEAEVRGAVASGTTTTVVAAQKRIEGVQDGDHDAKNPFETFGEAEMRGAADSTTPTTVVAQKSIESLQVENSNIKTPVGTSNEKTEMIAAAHSGTAATEPQRIEQVQDGDWDMEASIGAFNEEAEVRGTADLSTTTTVAGEQRIEELTELVQSQTCSMTGNLSHTEQPMVPVNLPCNEIRQTAGASAMLNCQSTRVHAPCQPSQTQVPLRNTGLCDQPVVQSQLHWSADREQPHISNPGSVAIMQSANSYVQETLSLRCNAFPSSGSRPLQNELDRIVKEREEAVKIHEDMTTQLKSAFEKEIQEIQKKYDIMLEEARNALLQKKLELESIYKKVYANKLLADALKSTNEKMTPSSTSQEALLNAILQLPQFNLPAQSTLVSSAQPTPPPVQVVHQLSELVSDATCSTLHNTGSPLTYHARYSAPPLLRPPFCLPFCPPRPVSCVSTTSDMFYGLMNQQTAGWPRAPVSSRHHLQFSPVQLGSTPQNPLQL